MKASAIFLGLSLLTAAAAAQVNNTMEAIPLPPITIKGNVTDNYFGTTVPDPYRWLEDDRSEDTKQWVTYQNGCTQAYLSAIPYRNAIRNRLTGLMNYERYSSPSKEGEWLYYSKNDGLQNQAIIYRQKPGGPAEVFLDPNKFSEDGTTSLAGMSFSNDGSLCAYQVSEGGSDWRKVYVISTADKKQVAEPLTDVKFSGTAWRGNQGFYYSSYDKPKQGEELTARNENHKIYFHKLGSPQGSDQLIFGGTNTPRRYLGAYLTEDERFLVITAANTTYGNELYVQDLSQPGSKIIPVITGFNNQHSVIANRGGTLYIETSLNAPNNRLVTVNAAAPQPANWKNLIPETDNVLNITTGAGKIFAQYLKDATSYIVQYDMAGQKQHVVKLPGVGTASGLSAKSTDEDLYYTFTSYIYPPTIFKYNPRAGTSAVYKASNVQFNPADYESKQVFYTSKDGTKVPMIITYKKGTKLNGQNPTMLYAYGGFNISLTPAFSVANIILLEQGGIYAVANLRGGGEYGEKWHAAGTKLQKQNVFDDFKAAAEYLITHKYTSSERLAVSGGSNGGLLVGAFITQNPTLAKVAFPAVGVMDMLRYHKFTAGAGWASDYGTADDSAEMFKYLYGYSPYHNIKAGVHYPATMVTTADHDDRVVPAHSFKFAAALQAAGSYPALIRIDTKAGHGAGKSTAQIINEVSDKLAFMFYNMKFPYKENGDIAAP